MKKITQAKNGDFVSFLQKINNEGPSIIETEFNIDNQLNIGGKMILNPYDQSKITDIPDFLVNTLIPFSVRKKSLVLQSGINEDNTYFIINGVELEKLTREELMIKLLMMTIEPHNRLDVLYLGEKFAARKVIIKKIKDCECWMNEPIM